MPRKSESGKYIISAGEVGAYVVCPEAWRLSTLQKVPRKMDLESRVSGEQLHAAWAEQFSEAVTLNRRAKIIALLLLVIIAIKVYLL